MYEGTLLLEFETIQTENFLNLSTGDYALLR